MNSRPEQFFRVLAEVSDAIQAGGDLDEVLAFMLRRIAETLGARGCTLRELDAGSGALRLRAACGLSRAYLDKGDVWARHSLSEVFEDGPVVIRDVSRDPRIQYPEAAAAEGIVAVVGLPLDLVGGVRQVLRIYFDRATDVDDDAIRFLDAVASQGAAAVRCRLLQTRYFDTFRSVMRAIHAGQDTGTILQTIVDEVGRIMAARGAIFWVVDRDERRIVHRVGSGFDFRSLAAADYGTLLDLFPLEAGTPTVIDDVRYEERLANLERLGKKRVQTVVGIPVAIVDAYTGILAVYFGRRRELAESEGHFLQALAEQGAVALQKALRWDEEMLAAFRQTVTGLALALEAKDPFTHGHSIKVANYARHTAVALGLAPPRIETVYHAGLLHDIGKIGMQDRVLSRLGRLSAREMDAIRMHPVIGARILSPLTFLHELVPLVRHHHERWDGRGYPDGLAGTAIPLGARILAVCDAFDCMLSGRPHMAPVPLDAAMEQLASGAGSRFDPDAAAALAAQVRREPQLATPLAPVDDYLAQFRVDRPRPRRPVFEDGTYPTSF